MRVCQSTCQWQAPSASGQLTIRRSSRCAIANGLVIGNTLAMTTNTGDGREREFAAEGAPRGGIPADTFANRLILARAYAGHLSQREAADLCGLGRGAWTNWERGARCRDLLDVVGKVSEKLGVDHDWLLFGGPLASGRARPIRRTAGQADT